MIRTIVTDKNYLSISCDTMNVKGGCYAEVIEDLMDTANAHYENCAGLAANQIGECFKAFVMRHGKKYIGVVNPEILRAEKATISTEGCLSRPNRPQSKVKRHRLIWVKFWCPEKKEYVKRHFQGFEAFVFQHETDHGNGILI